MRRTLRGDGKPLSPEPRRTAMVVLQDRRREAQAKTDEFSRVCLAIRVRRRCQAVDATDTIEELLKLYPPPTHLRMNNGPEFIAYTCRSGAKEWLWNGVQPPGSPWENPLVESFNGAIHQTICLGPGSKAVGRVPPNRVQSLQTAFGSHKN